MKIGVLGSGDVGKSLADGFLKTGHSVAIGSRSADNPSALEWAGQAGDQGSAGTFADAANYGELLVVAIKGTALPALVDAVGVEPFGTKVVIDVTNPLDFSKGTPDLAIKGDDSGGETLQRLVPNARVVKAFNIVNHTLMFQPDLPGGPPDMLIAGDDAPAKEAVTRILKDFGWPTIDLGGITSARWLEAMCMAWVMAGMATGNWRQAFKLLRD